MNNHIVEILPNLWLSSYKYALNIDFLKKKKIATIINCTKNIKFTNLNRIEKIRVSVNDDLKEEEINKLYDYFPYLCDLIDKKLNQLKPVLIHCYAGQQRSASVIAAYLMNKSKLSYIESIIYIQSKKDNSFKPAINFSSALKKYENIIHN